jgi:hypothetical protein
MRTRPIPLPGRSAAFAALLAATFTSTAVCAVPEGCSLDTVDGITILRLSGSPRDRGYAHGFLLARQIMDLFRRYMAFVVRDPDRYANVIRRDVRDRFSFPKDIEAELDGMLAGLRDRLGPDGMKTQFGRPLDGLDLRAVQALPDWYPFACSAFVAWGTLSPDGPVAGRNMDFFVHPVLLENHLLVVHARRGKMPAHLSLTWPSMVGSLTGVNEHGVAAFILDAAPAIETDKRGFLARTIAARRIVEEADTKRPAASAFELLKNVPTRWGGNIFVAGRQTGSVDGAMGVLERDVHGTTLRVVADDPLGPGVPALACTNHFRKRRRASRCYRYDIIANAMRMRVREGQTRSPDGAVEILLDARQFITLQSIVVNLKTLDVRLRLARPTGRVDDVKTVRIDARTLLGTKLTDL